MRYFLNIFFGVLLGYAICGAINIVEPYPQLMFWAIGFGIYFSLELAFS